MQKEKAISFISSSFLSPLLEDENITDISYNGDSIFYLHNLKGRQKSDISIDEEGAKDFIRQIANLCEKQFSYQNPKLDASFGRFRINATHPSIARRNNDSVLNFSIRIASIKPRIDDNSTFLNAELSAFFKVLLYSKASIVIGGTTGCGKTEFQKYLVRSLPRYSRVLVIDNVLELDGLESDNELDMNIWQSDEKNKEATIQELVRNALRSNPDWVIVAESRGKEMIEVLNSAMTGHPIITTLHAFDVNNIPTRIARMVMMNEQKQDFQMLMEDIYYTFSFYVFLKREIDDDGLVHRYISEIMEVDNKGVKNSIYKFKNDKHIFNKIRPATLEKLSYKDNEIFIKTFTEDKE